MSDAPLPVHGGRRHGRPAAALVLNAVSPAIGGVLVRGEKGTAKSTVVRGAGRAAAAGRRGRRLPVRLRPGGAGPGLPGRPAPGRRRPRARPARLVELPVGATEDRLLGSLRPGAGAGRRREGLRARAAGRRAPRACSTSTRSTCCTTTWSTCCSTPPRWAGPRRARGRLGHGTPARFLLVGTMNPEEGELRPQLLDRFGLAVDVARQPRSRRAGRGGAPPAGVRRRSGRLRRPACRRARPSWPTGSQAARALLPEVDARPTPRCGRSPSLRGVRRGRDARRPGHRPRRGRARRLERPHRGQRDDVRVAARLALPHRRRRDPFDAPGSGRRPTGAGASPTASARAGRPGRRSRVARAVPTTRAIRTAVRTAAMAAPCRRRSTCCGRTEHRLASDRAPAAPDRAPAAPDAPYRHGC